MKIATHLLLIFDYRIVFCNSDYDDHDHGDPYNGYDKGNNLYDHDYDDHDLMTYYDYDNDNDKYYYYGCLCILLSDSKCFLST